MTRVEWIRESDIRDWTRARHRERWDGTGPVVAERTGGKFSDNALVLSIQVVFVAEFIAMLIVTVATWADGGPVPVALIFTSLAVVMAAGTLLIYINLRVRLLENGISIEGDRFLSLRHGRVLREIPLDAGTTVDVWFPDVTARGSVEQVEGYAFERGRFVRSHVSTHDYPQEVIWRIWPNVAAAVRERGLRAGEELARLIEEERGADPERFGAYAAAHLSTGQ
jgi:hypothetical protein